MTGASQPSIGPSRFISRGCCCRVQSEDRSFENQAWGVQRQIWEETVIAGI